MRDFFSKNGLVQLAKMLGGTAATLGVLGFTSLVAPFVGGTVVKFHIILFLLSSALFLLGWEGRINDILDKKDKPARTRRRKHRAHK